MRIRTVFRLWVMGTIAATSSSSLLAGSLETEFTIVTVSDLPVGKWTRVESADGRRYSVKNASEQPVEVLLVAAKPFAEPRKLRPYKPIPDPAWLTIKPGALTLEPGKSGEAELTLAVPDDPAYANEKYEVWLVAKTTGQQFGVGLVTRIRVHTAARPSPENGEHGEKKAENP